METLKMETEDEPVDQQPAQNNNLQKRKKKKKKPPQHSADIVFYKGHTVVTMPSLSKALQDVTDAVIGLQYVWEYRSPSKAVQPHYQCKLCGLSYTQHDIIAHVRSWKHSLRYMKRAHPDKTDFEEKDGVESMEIRVAIRAAASEVESAEGRGQIRVILKEPFKVAGFQKLKSAFPKAPPPPLGQGMGLMGPPFDMPFPSRGPPPDQGMGLMGAPFDMPFSSRGPPPDQEEGPMGPPFDMPFPSRGPPPDQEEGPMGPPFGPRFHDSRFPGEFPSHGGPPSDFPSGRYEESGYGRRMSSPAFPDRSNASGPLSDPISPGRNGYGRGGPMVQGPKTVYPKDYQENFRDRPASQPNDRPGILGPSPQNSKTQALLKHLETFQIENENDAQLVLKVTKKLTDALMEFRLRNIPAASTFVNPSTISTNLSNAPSRMQGDRYSSSSSGPSRYLDGPQRYFK